MSIDFGKELSAAHRAIRSSLLSGGTVSEMEELATATTGLLHTVESTCTRLGVEPENLRGRSRQAYVFLKGITSETIESATTRPSSRTSSIRGIKGRIIGLSEFAWKASSDPDAAEKIRSQARSLSTEVSSTMARSDLKVRDLTERSYAAVAWANDLANHRSDNYASALQTAKSALGKGVKRFAGRRIHFRPAKVLWKTFGKGHSGILFNPGFVVAEEPVWVAIGQLIRNRKNEAAKQTLNRFTESDGYRAIHAYLQKPEGAASGRGVYHDLGASFDRVNEKYFEGRMPKPTVGWSKRLTTRTFGLCKSATDEIVLSMSMDSPEVEQYVVDFVMYHEMLHIRYPAEIRAGKRMAHTPRFKKAEADFDRFEDAEKALKRLARSWSN